MYESSGNRVKCLCMWFHVFSNMRIGYKLLEIIDNCIWYEL